MAKPRKTFAQMAAERPKYNPEVEGYGDPDEWRSAFKERMGLEEAQKVVGSRSARELLGLALAATWAEIVKAYRAAMLRFHPDRASQNGLTQEEATQKTKEVNAAFAILAKEFGK